MGTVGSRRRGPVTTIPSQSGENLGTSTAPLTAERFDAIGTPTDADADVTLVLQAKQEAQSWLQSKKWILLWQDADILYQSPRPLSIWENTYIQEPNVTRFTVAKLCNAMNSTMTRGLFYEDPPLMLRARKGASVEAVRWKTQVMSAKLKEANFKQEVSLGIEQMNLLGTTVFKACVGKKRVCVPKRKASVTQKEAGGRMESIVLEEPPQVTDEYKTTTCISFEMLDIAGDVVEGLGGDVLVDPKLDVPPIRSAKWVIHRSFVDYYDILELALDADYFGLREGSENEQKTENGTVEVETDEEGHPMLAPDVKAWWFPPTETANTPSVTSAQGNIVHHAESPTALSSNPLSNKLEMLEYLNQRTGTLITVLNGRKVIRRGTDMTRKVKYYSANYWNRRKAWLGMGIGLIAGQDQRVEQGGLNSALKVLNLALNTGYAMEQGGGQPTGMIRTGLGKIWTVNDITKMPKLLDTVKVDPSIWQVLAESRMQSESTVGADQQMVQGSSMGPRSSITRTRGGANIMANASATRTSGPMERLIEQVLVPFFYDLDEMIYRYVPDAEILDILGQALGKEAVDSLDLQAYHDARCDFDVLAGAYLAAKQTMTQSLVILGEYVLNPQLQQFLADVHGVYLDQLEFMKLVLTASEWGQGVAEQLIRKLTPEMKQKMQAKQGAPDPKLAAQMTLNQQKQQAESALEDQKTQNRITRDITVDAFRQMGEPEAVAGVPAGAGLGAEEGEAE